METRAMQATMQAAIQGIGTPLYLFDEAEFHARSTHLRSLLPADVELCYAIKANSFIIEQAARDTERIEVCSPGELRICQVLNIPAEKLVISGVYKDPSLMRELVTGWPGIARYTIESTRQFEVLEEEASKAGVRIPVLVRLASDSQFGVDGAEAKMLAKRCADSASMEFEGIQLFAGTQKTSTKRQRHEIAKADALIGEIERECGVEVHEFEYGAGLPVLYFDADDEAQRKQDEMARNLAELLGEMEFTGKVIVELGRAMAASCGTYATRIVDAKCSDGVNYAIVDGGKHQMVYYGNAMGMSQPPCTVLPGPGHDEDNAAGIASTATAAEAPAEWAICGSLCTTTDILAKKMPLGDIRIGDVLLFDKAGAYCMTEGVSLFLSRDLPAVVIAELDGALRLARDHMDIYPANTPGHSRLRAPETN